MECTDVGEKFVDAHAGVGNSLMNHYSRSILLLFVRPACFDIRNYIVKAKEG
jgi:hypothetical protein